MSVLAIFTGRISESQYESLRKEINWEKVHPDGGVVHAVGFDQTGDIHIADVWESAEEYDAFVEHRLMPALRKLGITPPDVGVYPVHNINAYKSIDKHRI